MKQLKKLWKKILPLIVFIIAAFIVLGKKTPSENPTGQTNQSNQPAVTQNQQEDSEVYVDEYEFYTSKEEVAAYLHKFGHLPDNYITKKEAEKLGWDSGFEYLSDVLPGMSIGGTYFGNYEKHLPEQKGREYYECDIDYKKGSRGGKRLVYSNDGLIFYTDDHYETFEQLY